MTSSARGDDYVMGDSAHERRRLAYQADLIAPFTRRVLERAGITEGMRVLDVGSDVGHGFDAVVGRLVYMYGPDVAASLRAAAARVRPGGVVVAQEADFTFFAHSVPAVPLLGGPTTGSPRRLREACMTADATLTTISVVASWANRPG